MLLWTVYCKIQQLIFPLLRPPPLLPSSISSILLSLWSWTQYLTFPPSPITTTFLAAVCRTIIKLINWLKWLIPQIRWFFKLQMIMMIFNLSHLSFQTDYKTPKVCLLVCPSRISQRENPQSGKCYKPCLSLNWFISSMKWKGQSFSFSFLPFLFIREVKSSHLIEPRKIRLAPRVKWWRY